MKILLLNYEFPPVGGGGGHFSEDVCRHLARRGHVVRVQTAHLKGLPRVEARDGYTIYRSPSLRRHAHTCTVREMASFIALNLLPAWRQARGFQPDVLYVHFAVPTGVVGWFIHRVLGIPYVLNTHLGDIPGAIPDQTEHVFRWIKPLTRPIWREAAVVTVLNEYLRGLARQSYQVPMEILPIGVNLRELPQSTPLPHKPVGLVFAGRFNPQKNLLFLIDILTRVADLDWRLDMAGDGPLMPAVREKGRQAGLSGRIVFHGWVTQPEVDVIMSENDVLVMPSITEGIPVVGIRALGTGLAILASNAGGIPGVVEDGVNGFLCPVNDLTAFAGRLRELLTSEERLGQMKQASRDLAPRFDLETITDRLEELFHRAVVASNQ